jgi:hypothetical protein
MKIKMNKFYWWLFIWETLLYSAITIFMLSICKYYHYPLYLKLITIAITVIGWIICSIIVFSNGIKEYKKI